MENFLVVQKFYRTVGIIFFLLFLLSTVGAKGQSGQRKAACDLSFEYEVQHTSSSENNGIIYITRLEGTGPFTIGLYDLLAGKQEFDVVRQYDRMPVGQSIKVFEDVASGTYLIRVDNNVCSRSLSDLSGIEVK
jgi:hypothetical protein